MTGAGLRVERVTSFVSLLLPALLVSRMAYTGEGGAAHEYHPPAAVNAIGSAVMALERGLIRSGVSWPAGGSLLAVARKPG